MCDYCFRYMVCEFCVYSESCIFHGFYEGDCEYFTCGYVKCDEEEEHP